MPDAECVPAHGGRRCETHGRPLYPDGRCGAVGVRPPCVMCGTEEAPICCMVCLRDLVRRAWTGEPLPEYVDAQGPRPLLDCDYLGGNEDPSRCNSTRCPRHGKPGHDPSPLSDEVVEARVFLVDEVCTWLAANGHKDAADLLHEKRNVFLLAPFRTETAVREELSETKPYACVACLAPLASSGMCPQCSRAWDMGRAETLDEIAALHALARQVRRFRKWRNDASIEGMFAVYDAWAALLAEPREKPTATSSPKLTCAWFDEDAEAGGIYRCARPATHYSCNNGPREQAWNACEEHKCRCAQPAAPVDDEHADTTNEKEKSA